LIKVALRGLAGRKLRAVLTGIAIVLGVAMISGTYILTDTINRAFTTLFTESYAGTDAVVTGRGLDISVDGEAPPSPPVDGSLLGTVMRASAIRSRCHNSSADLSRLALGTSNTSGAIEA
jgi:putative ABC transport system permease protein